MMLKQYSISYVERSQSGCWRLLEGRADPNEIDNEGETSLHQATQNGYSADIKLLFEKDARTILARLHYIKPPAMAQQRRWSFYIKKELTHRPQTKIKGSHIR